MMVHGGRIICTNANMEFFLWFYIFFLQREWENYMHKCKYGIFSLVLYLFPPKKVDSLVKEENKKNKKVDFKLQDIEVESML